MEIDNRPGDLEHLEPDACIERLASEPVSRLAFTTDRGPDVLPINHVVLDRAVYFRSAPGTKLGEAAAGDRVALEADHYDRDRHAGWSVVVKGHARIVTDDVILERLHALPFDPWSAPDKRMFWVGIEPDTITGREIRR